MAIKSFREGISSQYGHDMVTNERNDLLLYRYMVNIAPTNGKFLLRRSIRDVTQAISIKK